MEGPTLELSETTAPARARHDGQERRKATARATLVAQFQIESALIGVPKVARIVGLSPSTIYTYMRQGTFFMPYRLVNGTAMVSMDDLVDWYCSTVNVKFPAAARTETPLPEQEVDPIEEHGEPAGEPEDLAGRLAAQAIKAMGLGTGRARPKGRVSV